MERSALIRAASSRRAMTCSCTDCYMAREEGREEPHKMSEEMDAIDTRQQKEIDELMKVNERQDSYIKNIIWAFVMFAVIQFTTMIFFMREFDQNCPHEGCPHHVQK